MLHVMIDVPSARYIVLAIYVHVYLFFLGGFYFHYKTCHTYVWGKINLKWKFWVFTYIIIPAFINKILHMNDNLCGLLASFVPRLLVATQSLHGYKANGHVTITLVTVHLMHIHMWNFCHILKTWTDSTGADIWGHMYIVSDIQPQPCTRHGIKDSSESEERNELN